MQLAKRWHVCGSQGKRNCHTVLVLVASREIVKVEPQTVLGKRLEECKLKVTVLPKIIEPNGSVVWLGAVCVRVGEFFASPGRWTKVVLSR